MSKTYLVTGGTGFIGSALVRRLLADGARVRVFDNNSRGALRRLAGIEDDIEVSKGDIRDTDAMIEATRGVDCVLHLAFINGTELFYSMPEEVLDVGIRGMLSVLDACRVNKVPEMVLASSSEVYQTPQVIPTPETVPFSIPDPLNPRYSYGGGKIACELMAINYGRDRFERMAIFRPHNVIGPDMGWEHVLPQFIVRMLELRKEHAHGVIPFPIQGDGMETRAFIDVDDFTDGLMRVVANGEHLGIYNIGTEEERNMRDVATHVAREFAREIEIVPGALAVGGTPRRCADISKLRSLGFEPATPFATSVRRMVAWYGENLDLMPNRR